MRNCGITRPVCLLMLLQAVCLATGLWIHDRFLIVSAQGVNHAPVGSSPTVPPAEARMGSRVQPGQKQGAQAPPKYQRLVDAMPAAGAMAFAWTLLLQSAVAYFLLARVQGEHSRQQSKSDEQTQQRTEDLLRTRDAVIFGLAKLSESRDPEIGHHLERISLYSIRLAAALSRHPKYRDVVRPSFVRLIGISSALHDIGKVGVEDSVLLKPASLNSGERFRMQLHAEVGADCIRAIERRLGRSNFLEMAREIAYSHHEHWDGSGYPQGLQGEQIPLAARIVSIADVYDALSVRRVYKEPFPHEKCVAIIREEAGKQFDPEIVNVFLQIEHQFADIARRFADVLSETTADSDESFHELGAMQMTAEQQDVFLTALSQCGEAEAGVLSATAQSAYFGGRY